MQAPSLPFHPLLQLKLAPEATSRCNTCGSRPTVWDLKASSEQGVLIVRERYCRQHGKEAQEKYLRLYGALAPQLAQPRKAPAARASRALSQ